MSYIWVIIGAIVVGMAIIGYIAENSSKSKTTEEKKDVIPEVAIPQANQVSTTWSKDAKPKDEKQEIEHKVASIDDWSKIPTTDNISQANLNQNKQQKENTNDKQPDAELFANPIPLPSNNQAINPVNIPATSKVMAPSNVASPSPLPPENQVANTQISYGKALEEIPKEQITEPINTENIWS